MELREECQFLRAIFVLPATERAPWVQPVAGLRALGRLWRACRFSKTYCCLCHAYAFDLCLAPVSLSHSNPMVCVRLQSPGDGVRPAICWRDTPSGAKGSSTFTRMSFDKGSPIPRSP